MPGRFSSQASEAQSGSACRRGGAIRVCQETRCVLRYDIHIVASSPNAFSQPTVAGSESRRGCQSIETTVSFVANGRRKLVVPWRRACVCLSGTLATRSDVRASATAVAKPGTTVAIFAQFRPRSMLRRQDLKPRSPLARYHDVIGCRVTPKRDFAFGKLVFLPHHADPAIPDSIWGPLEARKHR